MSQGLLALMFLAWFGIGVVGYMIGRAENESEASDVDGVDTIESRVRKAGL